MELYHLRLEDRVWVFPRKSVTYVEYTDEGEVIVNFNNGDSCVLPDTLSIVNFENWYEKLA